MLHRLLFLPKPVVPNGRRFLLFCFLALMALSVKPLWAQEATSTPAQEQSTAATAALSGRLVQGTPDAAPPADQPVTLLVSVDGQPTESTVVTANADGEFRAEELNADAARTYVVETVYEGVTYRTQPISLADGDVSDVELTLYEATDDPSGLFIARLNWVIDFAPGEVIVGVIITYGNSLDRTYTGQTVEGIDQPVTTAFTLPDGALDVGFQPENLSERFVESGNTLYDTAAVPPGPAATEQQVSFGYRVPFEGNSVQIAQEFLYEIGEVNLLVAVLPDESAISLNVLTPETEQTLSFLGNEQIQDRTFALWTGESLEAQPIVLDFGGLIPAGAQDPRGTANAAAPLVAPPRPPTSAPWIMAGVLAVGLLALAVWEARRRPERAGDSAQQQQALAAERAALIRRIAQLDDQHAIGMIPNERWSRERTRLKTQLLVVANRLAQARGDVAASENAAEATNGEPAAESPGENEVEREQPAD